MVQTKRTVRVVLKIEADSQGYWVMKQCKDSWTTLPFRWPSKEAAASDLDVVVQALVKKGYEVIKPTEGGPAQV